MEYTTKERLKSQLMDFYNMQKLMKCLQWYEKLYSLHLKIIMIYSQTCAHCAKTTKMIKII